MTSPRPLLHRPAAALLLALCPALSLAACSASSSDDGSATATPPGTFADTSAPDTSRMDSTDADATRSSSTGPTDDAPPDPASLPLLPAGRHLGVTPFGSGDPPEEPGVRASLEQAAGDGLSVLTFYADWFALEASPGTVDVASFREQLRWQRDAGFRPLVNLLTIDIARLNLPPDLLSPDGQRLAEGRAFDDDDIVERFAGVLDAVVPPLVEHGGFLLLLGNEVDEHFAEFTEADPEAFARFIGRARDHARTLEPDLAIGITLTSHAFREQGPLVSALAQVTDLIVVNDYPLQTEWGDEWFTVLDMAEIPGRIDGLVALFEGRPVVLQELGCPSGEGSDSSEALQEACFRAMLQALEAHDNVRLVNIFTLHDFDEPTCDLIVEVFGLGPEDLPGRAFERWRSYLCTLGLLRPDGSPKPAWDTVLSFGRAWLNPTTPP